MRLTFEQIQAAARARGWTCLLSRSSSRRGAISWRCEKGHRFVMQAGTVRAGRLGCPVCAKTGPYAKYPVAKLHAIAREHRGKCLTPTVVNNTTDLTWRCRQGHVWTATRREAARAWCARCKRDAYETRVREIAKKKGGRLLSPFRGNPHPLLWQCRVGHRWKAAAGRIVEGRWCGACIDRRTVTIRDMQKTAASRGGRCLSPEYRNPKTKLRWRCREGHEWSATPGNVRNNGSWCPVCAYR